MNAKSEIQPARGMKKERLVGNQRVEETLQAAASSGFFDGKEVRLSARAHERLLRAAEESSGLMGDALVEYALAKVALEDDFVRTLLALRGTVSAEIDLEF